MALTIESYKRLEAEYHVVIITETYQKKEEVEWANWATKIGKLDGAKKVLVITASFDQLLEARDHIFVESLLAFSLRADENVTQVMRNFYIAKDKHFSGGMKLTATSLRKVMEDLQEEARTFNLKKLMGSET